MSQNKKKAILFSVLAPSNAYTCHIDFPFGFILGGTRSISLVLLKLPVCVEKLTDQTDLCFPSEQTQGLKHGRAIVLSTCAAVASIVTGVLAGMLALGERLPSAPAARFSLLLGW